MSLLLLLIGILLPPPLFAESEIKFEIPVDCNVGVDCFIQNYVDTDPSGGYRDYSCGRLSYDGHKGVDLRLPNFSSLKNDTLVFAAADGYVKRTRNSMEDIAAPDKVKGKECGNGLVIDHGDGWVTQYCHMKKGSIIVFEKDYVKAGQVVGKIGISGKTEFPHLHFAVRHNDRPVDPFTGRFMVGHPPLPPPQAGGEKESQAGGEEKEECEPDSRKNSLWSDDALEKMPYLSTALLNMGIASEEPSTSGMRNGEYTDTVINSSAEKIVIWTHTMGIQAGDLLVTELTMPHGNTRFFKKIFPDPKAEMFYFSGLKKKMSTWQTGSYKGKVTLLRDEKVIYTKTKEFTVDDD